MSVRAPRPLAPALERLAARLAPATTLARVQAVWEQVAGSAIADVARPTAERDGVLSVSCSAAVWAHELEMMSSELIARLNRALREDAIRELRCRSM
jgi:predicted nucleic acid-binding Zn ribbon protein